MMRARIAQLDELDRRYQAGEISLEQRRTELAKLIPKQRFDFAVDKLDEMVKQLPPAHVAKVGRVPTFVELDRFLRQARGLMHRKELVVELRRTQRAYVKALRKLANVKELRELGLDARADQVEEEHQMEWGDPWDRRRLAGDYLPAVYQALAGGRATHAPAGRSVEFIRLALEALGITYSAVSIVSAMHRYGVGKRERT